MESISLNLNFHDTLECPICCDYYTPPIYLCPNGHSICGTCSSNSRCCPLCRAQLSRVSRNLVLENILEQISVPCKFEGCKENTTLANRNQHFKVCPFNNFTKCIECNNNEEDLVAHLIRNHEYKEISMEESGGLRSFSGPFDSWVRDTDWPKGVWRFGNDPLVVHAKSYGGIFHIFLYRIARKPMKVSLKVENGDYSISFKGEIPNIMEYKEKMTDPHFNCEVNLLLSNFVKMHDDDEEILRLSMKVKRLPSVEMQK
ncbi:unnamed protein product [Blepharisma stoltei]|uniref:RING-type domain-containing protein n=1 Tax=Blepharisma stoltei TaxID=1481888 RepID=A0AAU9JRB1_9CILI|nr:unnamed protein product [Blepharisma stoltei]